MSKELEKRLAELLGYSTILLERGSDISMHLAGSMVYTGYKQHARHIIPQWTEDDGAAFRLAIDHDIGYEMMTNIVWIPTPYRQFAGLFESYADHPDKYAAVRIAIVKAVIAKLEGGK